MNMDEFVNNLKDININISDEQLNQLKIYADYLVEYNSHTNLTAITEESDIYLKHFYDSILLAKYIDLNKYETLIDVGTGAGFPGMVIKIMFPHLNVTLLDSNNKKLMFLDELIDKLSLAGVKTVNERSEEFAKSHFESFDVVTSRAVAALPVLTELCLPMVKIGGVFVPLKGSAGNEELEMSTNIIKKLNGEVIFKTDYNLPIINDGRTIFCIKKIGKTPSGYPRDYGRIKKDYQRLLNGNK